MCERCDGLSRRRFLKGATLAAAALAGCEQEPVKITPVDPQEKLEGEGPKAPIVQDSRPIVVPPPVPARRTDYGDIMPRRAWTNVPMEYGRGRPMNGVDRITLHHSGDGK